MLRPLTDHELHACRYPTTGAAASPLRQLNARQARLYRRGPSPVAFAIVAILAGAPVIMLALYYIATATRVG